VLDAKALELIAKVNKALGEDTFIRASQLVTPRRFTSGSLGLDVILGGGLPGNQWTEIIGKYSSGKTATALKMIAANQAADPGFTALWVAAEPFDDDQAQALGVDLDRLILQPHGQEMEVAFEVMLTAAESQAVDCIVLDSYPALVADEEDEKSMAEDTVAKGARLFGRFCRKGGKATRRAYDGSERAMCGIIINQWRDKIGGFSRFGTPQTTPGGNAKDYFFWARLDVARDEWLTEKRPGVKDPVTVGQTMKYKMIKNKGAAPQQIARVGFYFRGAPTLGFRRGDYDLASEYFTVGTLYRVIRKSGGWYYFGDEKWQGGDKVVQALREDRALQHAVAAEVLELAANPRALDSLDAD
jgi:recombination protein RecA